MKTTKIEYSKHTAQIYLDIAQKLREATVEANKLAKHKKLMEAKQNSTIYEEFERIYSVELD